MLCNLIIVLGLQVFIGNSGVYSFGQLGFATVGAYMAAFLTLPAAFVLLQTPDLPHFLAVAQLEPLPSTLLAGLVAALIALVTGPVLMRTSTLAIPISTFAFLIVVYNVAANWEGLTGGSGGLFSIPTTTSIDSAGLWAAAASIAALIYKWSASGYRLLATREDEVAARSIGVNVMRERLLAFTLSAVMCGIGGALAAHQSGVLAPATFYFGASVTTLTMLVVGGARSVLGAVVGTLAVTVVNEVLRGFEAGGSVLDLVRVGEAPGLAAIGVGLILLLAMIALPDGLSGGREAGELKLHRRFIAPQAPAASKPVVKDRESAASTEHSLKAERISLSFGGLAVLRDVDLELRVGQALGLIGPNGAGKTTLVNVLSGFQQPDTGSVALDGVAVTGRRPARLAHAGLTRTFQAALPFPHLSVLESVAVGALGVGVRRREAVAIAAEVLARLHMGRHAGTTAGLLPPGQQRLLGIARALATTPRYLLLDEPAAGLNGRECQELISFLEKVLDDFACGILLIEHDMNVVMNLCPRVQVLDDGMTLRVGARDDIRSDPAVIESYLGSDFRDGAHA